MLREVLGKPGSFTRWLAFSAAWLVLCLIVFLHVGWVLKIFVILLAGVIPFSAFRARSLLIGDEDEVRVAVKREVAEARRLGPVPDEEERLDPEYWLSRGSRFVDDAPPPPVAEDAPEDSSEEAPWR